MYRYPNLEPIARGIKVGSLFSRGASSVEQDTRALHCYCICQQVIMDRQLSNGDWAQVSSVV